MELFLYSNNLDLFYILDCVILCSGKYGIEEDLDLDVYTSVLTVSHALARFKKAPSRHIHTQM